MISDRIGVLAIYVVLENYQGMMCDYPQAYEGQPGFEFLREVPTTICLNREFSRTAGMPD